MPRQVDKVSLPGMSPGTSRQLTVFRYGRPGARPKAYLHAGMHADEPPGMLVLHHLCCLLDAADAGGTIRGEIVVVPLANPIGLDQTVNTTRTGRHELRSGTNFNRGFPDLRARLIERVSGELTHDAAANVTLIQQALRQLQAESQSTGELQHLQATLQQLAIDADFVIDLHCDDEAEAYLMARKALWPLAREMAADVGVAWLMESGASEQGSLCFDESCLAPWEALRSAVGPAFPVPLGCLAVCFEMRGINQVDDAMNRRDAAGLFNYLTRQGLIAGGVTPALIDHVEVVPAYEYVNAPKGGLAVHAVPLGSRVQPGDLVAHLIDPTEPDAARARTPLRASVAGAVISRSLTGQVATGDFIAMIVGQDWPQ
jgi:predicted deacylase